MVLTNLVSRVNSAFKMAGGDARHFESGVNPGDEVAIGVAFIMAARSSFFNLTIYPGNLGPRSTPLQAIIN